MRVQVEPTDALQDYIAEMSLREPDALRRLREETSDMPLALMQISPEQGQFLGLLVKALGARRIVEVGVFTGYSLMSMALALPEDGRLVGCDINQEWMAMAKRYIDGAGLGHKVDYWLGDATVTLAQMAADPSEAGSYDLAFIDADKENYWTYLEYALELLRPGGLVLVDNVLWHGAVIDDSAQDTETRALREFNARIRDDKRVDLSMVPLADGLTFAVKR